jgi:hypothetical protein
MFFFFLCFSSHFLCEKDDLEYWNGHLQKSHPSPMGPALPGELPRVQNRR